MRAVRLTTPELHSGHITAFCKLARLVGEAARCDNKAAYSLRGSHDALKFAHHIHTDFVGLPLFALNEKLLGTFG